LTNLTGSGLRLCAADNCNILGDGSSTSGSHCISSCRAVSNTRHTQRRPCRICLHCCT